MPNPLYSTLTCDIRVTILPLENDGNTIELKLSTLADFRTLLKSDYFRSYHDKADITYVCTYIRDGKLYEALFYDWEVAYSFASFPSSPVKHDILNK